ncbi:MAG TPA: DNA-formamidopyrimidine glycosylase family protein [Terriglobia bacterium]|nr:DNA-formamidopyrimidine glycosylase family protein [Terriglobia bacterium]
MPELAEVDYFRRQWNPGLGARVLRVNLRPQTRVFRGVQAASFVRVVEGATLETSECHGKQMLFRLSGAGWLGIHLGMTGDMRVESARFDPAPYDHLVLHQRGRSLVFRDPRQFGRVRFHQGAAPPDWWSNLPPTLLSRGFTCARMRAFLDRRRGTPIKAALLMQEGFPGIGNWMADEALWRAGVDPRLRSGRLSEAASLALYRAVRHVAAGAMRVMATEFRDPPPSWLFRHRWTPGGRCPRHHILLERATIGGRTTVWCSECQ